ncbi:MAG TPA: hypothetical protein VM490_25565, partial [Armatimonadaceae bacterium]|nr:hypothetical protein [Armatimonadaceae bacterium]
MTPFSSRTASSAPAALLLLFLPLLAGGCATSPARSGRNSRRSAAGADDAVRLEKGVIREVLCRE